MTRSVSARTAKTLLFEKTRRNRREVLWPGGKPQAAEHNQMEMLIILFVR